MHDQMKLLHACWCETTGQTLHFQATQRLFWELAKMEFTPDDLLCVLKHVLAYNKSHAHAPMKVQVHKLLGDLEIFASILADARARERNRVPKPTAKEIVLEQFRGVTPEPNGKIRHVSEIFDEMRKATIKPEP